MNLTHTRSTVFRGLSIATVIVILGVACRQEPTAVRPLADDVSFAKPVDCQAGTALQITMRDQSGDAVLSDGSGTYEEGVDGVGAHINGPTGNLMLNVTSSPSRRIGYSTSAGSGLSNARLYTNTHTNPGGNSACGLAGMVVGSTGSAAVGFELWQSPPKAEVIHYGKRCDGSLNAATRVVTTHADADTWTITGVSGVHCRPRPRGSALDSVGVAGPFQMTLVRQ
jgi:hypothetical protein